MTAPFTYRRRVGFGDCDPARIYYTPRAFDFCVEAIEAWWGACLSASWIGLLERAGLEIRFLRAESEFLRPLTAGQVVRVGVQVAGPNTDRLRFRLAGEGEDGEPRFRAGLTAGLFDRKRARFVPVSGEDRERIIRYRAACGDGGKALAGSGPEDPVLPPERRIFPPVLFTSTRRVVFGDCSPAGSITLPKIVEYAVEAAGEWFEAVPGVCWLELVSVRNQGAPAVSASCDLYRPVTAGQKIAMGVRVPRLGRASIALSIEGNDLEGRPLFDTRTTLCFIDQGAGFRSMPVPDELRRRIAAYREACGDGAG